MTLAYLTFIFFSVFGKKDDENEDQNMATRPLQNAEELLDRGQLESLAEQCLEVIGDRPNNIDAYWFLGLSLYQQGKHVEAISCFETVNRINPHWVNSTSAYIEASNKAIHKQSDNLKH